MPAPIHSYELAFHGGPAPTYSVRYTGDKTTQELLSLVAEAYKRNELLIFDDCAIAVCNFNYIQVKETPNA